MLIIAGVIVYGTAERYACFPCTFEQVLKKSDKCELAQEVGATKINKKVCVY